MRNKVTFQGKEGVWRTLPNGVHIFIPNGSDIDTELSKMTEDDWSSAHNNSEYATNLLNSVTYVDIQGWYWDNNHRLKPSEFANRVVRRAFEARTYRNPDMDELVLSGIKNSVSELILNDRGTNWFKCQLGYITGWTKRVQISVEGAKAELLSALSHEVGHAIDCVDVRYYYSSSFVSPTHNKTMKQLMLEEFPDLEYISDEVDIIEDARTKVAQDDTLSPVAKNMQLLFLRDAQENLVDMVQAVYGDDAAKNKFGWTPHSKGYFEEDDKNGATELFAELTESLFCDKDKTFYNVIKQYCPKTIDVYNEILEEVKKEWNSKK